MKYDPERFDVNIPITLTYTVIKDDDSFDTESKVYQINPKHRDGSPEKAQWTIPQEKEVKLFGWSIENKSYSAKYYWGVRYEYGRCIVLGFTSRRDNSKIARFECGNNQNIWHGYPADYIRDATHDCPSRDVLNKWEKAGLITKPEISRLIKGRGWKD